MNRFIETYTGKTYDITIIGGGITGSAVAYEAASRGFSVALLEKSDFGVATSAATSKMIHGGLRYLANFEFAIVRESLKERRNLENIAPNLVYPIPFLFPLYKNSTDKKCIMEIGMILYDLLSYDKGITWDATKRIPPHRWLSTEKIIQLEPIVKREGLNGGLMYYDCTNLMPERLTLAFIKSAMKFGAEVSNYSKVEDFIHESDRVAGVIVRDLLNDKTVKIKSKMTINCCGPWADIILELASRKAGAQKINRAEGIHIITPKLTDKHVITAATSSGMHFNILPWRGHSLIGTTDRAYKGHPDNYRVTKTSIEGFIAEINESFGRKDMVKYSDVTYAYGGLRPLVGDETKDVYAASRKYEIYDNEKDGLKGLITVEGGKYTTSRNLAENVLKIVSKKFGVSYKKSISDKRHLAGCKIPDINAFLKSAKSTYCDFSASTINYLARIYGTELGLVMDIARNNARYAEPLNEDGEMLAQVIYAVKNEMARTLTDIILRRTGIGTLGNPGAGPIEAVAEIAARELNWNSARTDRELQTVCDILSIP